jgi:sugar lactone lactonase YvrE
MTFGNCAAKSARCYRAAYVPALLVVLAGLTLSANAQNTISTIGGGGSVKGPATGNNADISGPSAVAKDNAGNTYIAVPNAQQVFKVDVSGNLTVFAGEGWSTEDPTKLNGLPATQASLNEPSGVSVDAAGNVYIADTTDYLIRKVNTSGIMSTVAGNTHLCQQPTGSCGDGGKAGAANLSYPTAAVLDSTGNIYIADTQDNKIRMVTKSTDIISTIAGTGVPCPVSTSGCGDGGPGTSAQLNNPQGLALDNKGNLYIADSGDGKIRVLNLASGIISTYAGTGNSCIVTAGCGDGGPATSANISSPWQLSMDSKNNLYIADAPESRIRMVAAGTGIISSVAGTGNQGFNGNGGSALSAYLNSPRGVFVDSSDNLTIADTGNQMVRTVSNSTGNISLLAGTGLGDAAALSAILSASRDVALDGNGNLFIADTANNRVRKMTLGSGSTITTVAGTGIAGSSGNNGPATSATLNSPYGLAVDSNDDIFIADSGNLSVRVVNGATGTITNYAGTGQPCNPTSLCGDGGPASKAQLAFPTTVALDSLGNLYIADAGANRIRKVGYQGTIGTIAGTSVPCPNATSPCGDGGPAANAQLNQPIGVAVDSAGNVYIADSGDNRIRKIDTSGNISAYAFNGIFNFGPDKVNALQSSYNTPMYMALDPHGNMYVSGSDFYYVVQRIDVNDQTVQSVAGRPGDPKYYGYAGDGGPATSADLNNFGVSVDGNGNLYIADGGNNRIRTVPLVPVANYQPSSLSFPATPLNTTSAPLGWTVTNNGSDDLYISNSAFQGMFQLQSITPSSGVNTCVNNIVTPGQSCTYNITFTPTGYGLQKGSFTLTDNAYKLPTQSVGLSGYGPDFSIAVNPNTLTVVRGNSGNSTITLTPSAGFNQTVKLTCTGVPSGTQCGASPNSLTLDGVDQATSTLTVKVGSTTAPGTYTLKVTGASVTTHATSLSLTVQ